MGMNKLYGSICVSDIPRELIRTANNGKKYISVEVCERKTPSQYGDTHYIKAWCKQAERKDGVNYFIGELKPSKYVNNPQAQELPQQAPQYQFPEPPPIDIDDVPF